MKTVWQTDHLDDTRTPDVHNRFVLLIPKSTLLSLLDLACYSAWRAPLG
jgi:hypothetical protein